MMRATGVQYCGDCIIREGDEIPGTVGCISGIGNERRSVWYLRERYYGVYERIVCRSTDKG